MVPVMKADSPRADSRDADLPGAGGLATGDRDLLPLFPEHSSVSPDGELAIGGVGVRDLAERFDVPPPYVIDRPGCGTRPAALRTSLPPATRLRVGSPPSRLPLPWPFKLFDAAGLSIDVAGAGELVMALAAGVPPERMYLHGNAKTTAELTMALDAGVATVVVDNFDDIDRLDQLATRPQRVLIRIIPGVAPKPTIAVHRGADSKFGLALDQAREAITRIHASEELQLDGLHLHIGSQILTPSRSPGPSRRSPCSASSRSTTWAAVSASGTRSRTRLPPSSSTWTDRHGRQELPAGRRQAGDRAGPVAGGQPVRHAVPGDDGQAHGRDLRAVDGGMADNLDVALTGQGFEAALATRMTARPDRPAARRPSVRVR